MSVRRDSGFDFSAAIQRAWYCVWQNKFILFLSLLVILTSGRLFGGEALYGVVFRNFPAEELGLPQAMTFALFGPELFPEFEPVDLVNIFIGLTEQTFAYILLGLVVFTILFFVIGLFWFIANGAIIEAVKRTILGEEAKLTTSVSAAWRRGWDLLIIASIPPIPILVGLIIAVILLGFYFRYVLDSRLPLNSPQLLPVTLAVGVALLIVLVPLLLLTLLLAIIKPLADRACMFEGLATKPAYRRGWEIAKENSGPVFLLLLLQFIFRSAVGSVLAGPRILSSICIFIAPFLWVVYGVEHAMISAVWTSAWADWTGQLPEQQITDTG